MTATQLRLLRIILLQLCSDIVQQLQITLFRVLSQCLNECPTQGSSSLSALKCIRTAAMSVFYLHGILADSLRSLRIFRTGKHDYICRRGLGHHPPLARRIANGGFLEESDSRLGNAA
jgi:hypothetical protein